MPGRPSPPPIQPFPPGVEVLVLPGFPDREFNLDEPGDAYPSNTLDVVKRLRGLGLTVDFSEPRDCRVEVTLKAHELWVPILQVAQDVFINLGAWQLVRAFELRAAARRAKHVEPTEDHEDQDEDKRASLPPLLHVRLAIVNGNEARWIEIDGAPDDVHRTLTQVQEELRE